MSQYVFSDNGVTTLGSNLGSSAVTLTVAVGTGVKFPTPAPGQIVSLTLIAAGSSTDVPNEIVYATARTGDTFTVIRGQEGTTAQDWSSGDVVANMATAEFYNSQATQAEIQTQAGNYAADTGAANAGIITLNPVPANLAALVGVPIRVLKMANPNTGAYTLNVNGLGAEPVSVGGVAMQAGQLPGSEIFEVVWNGANFDLTSPPGLVFNSNLAKMTLETIKANITDGAANPQDVGLTAFLNFLGFTTEAFTSPTGTIDLPFGLEFKYGTLTIRGNDTLIAYPVPFPNATITVMLCDGGTSPVTWAAPPSGYSDIGFHTYNNPDVDSGYGGTVTYWAFGF